MERSRLVVVPLSLAMFVLLGPLKSGTGQAPDRQSTKAGTSASARYNIKAPEAASAKATAYRTCSADFVLTPNQRRQSMAVQLKSNPQLMNRLFSSSKVGRSSEPAPADATALPLKLNDIETLRPSLNVVSDQERLAIIRQHQQLALIWGQKWPNGSALHVKFLNTDSSWNPIKTKVEQFAHKWEEFANVTFVFDDSPTAQIRVLLTDDNFSWSAIGTDAQSTPANQETMHYGWFNLQTPDDEYSRTVIHEFGHALGAIHEHQHPDAGIPWNKPAVYAYYASANPPWDQATVDLNMFKKYDRSILQYGAYDKDSIMEYPIPPTFTTNGFSIGWNKVLSSEDKAVIAWVYPKPH